MMTATPNAPELLTPASPTQRVGAAPSTAFAPVTHRLPMLSLNNAFADADVENFDRRVRDGLDRETIEYAVEPKFDGLAISMTYENGVLIRGATRGDGETCVEGHETGRGEDSSHHYSVVSICRCRPRTSGTRTSVEMKSSASTRGH